VNDPPETSGNLRLTERQRTAIGLLVAGKTQAAVAEELGVNPRTIWEWKRDSVFLAALNAEREAIREAMQHRVLALGCKALDALERTLDGGDSDSARVAAARLVLDRLLPTYSEAKADSASANSGPTRLIVVDHADLRKLEEQARNASNPRPPAAPHVVPLEYERK
jgi:DNA-binding CsgD family transcriptional regulator